jgi:hypothetical protein
MGLGGGRGVMVEDEEGLGRKSAAGSMSGIAMGVLDRAGSLVAASANPLDDEPGLSEPSGTVTRCSMSDVGYCVGRRYWRLTRAGLVRVARMASTS